MLRGNRFIPLLGAGILLSACESSPTGVRPSEAPFLATVAGSVNAQYEGEGVFHVFTPPPGLPRPASFRLFSSEMDRATRQVQTFQLQRIGSELPAPGTYALGDDADGGFVATYLHATPAGSQLFRATAGEVVITLSTPDRIEGSFQLTGSRICTGTGGQMSCVFTPGDAVDPDVPTVQVTGSFVALLDRARRFR